MHGFSDAEANGRNQIGGRDTELKSILLEELTVAGIPAHISTDPALDGTDPANICNKTTRGAGVQLEMGTTYRASLFAPGCNTRELRKSNTNAAFCNLVVALRKAMGRAIFNRLVVASPYAARFPQALSIRPLWTPALL